MLTPRLLAQSSLCAASGCSFWCNIVFFFLRITPHPAYWNFVYFQERVQHTPGPECHRWRSNLCSVVVNVVGWQKLSLKKGPLPSLQCAYRCEYVVLRVAIRYSDKTQRERERESERKIMSPATGWFHSPGSNCNLQHISRGQLIISKCHRVGSGFHFLCTFLLVHFTFT